MSPKNEVVFYKTIQGNKVVKEYIEKQPMLARAKIINTIDLLSVYGFSLLRTHWMKKIHSQPDLYELRIKSSVEYRFILYFLNNTFIILNGFEKKTQKIAKKEINLAKQRHSESLT